MIKGVNLGNWLVLEKWISPSLFEDVSATDESELKKELGENYEPFLETHRKSWITEEDIKQISEMGVRLLRIPVPYTIFDSGISYLDMAFDWAEKYKLEILIDMHTAPGGQNGFDNSGVTGLCTFHHDPQNADIVLAVLEKLANRYHNRKALWGIEILNEPADDKILNMLKNRLPSQYQGNLQQSTAVPTAFLKDFYLKSYQTLAPILGKKKIVIHDAFRLEEWQDFMTKDKFPNLVIDTHMYINFARYDITEPTLEKYLTYIQNDFKDEVDRASQNHDILIGEWSLANYLDQSDEVLDIFASQQLAAWKGAVGQCYWNYKVDDTVRQTWSFQKQAERINQLSKIKVVE